MDPDQFMGMSMHPAYQGAMPAEDVAAALAYLVSTLADEYRSDRTDGYKILQRAGFFKSMQKPVEVVQISGTQSHTPPDVAEDVADRGAGRIDTAHISQALKLARRLKEEVSKTKAEFDHMPVFIRPMARGAFDLEGWPSHPGVGADSVSFV